MNKLAYQEPHESLNNRISAHSRFSDFDLHQWISSNFDIKQGDNIFDVGCGNGNYIELFLDKIIYLKNKNKINKSKGYLNTKLEYMPSLKTSHLTYLLGVAGISCCVAMSMPQVHIVAYCVDLGFGPAVGAQMLSLMLLCGVASRIISGLVADLLGGVRTLLIGSCLQCLALFLYLPSGGMVSLYVVSLVFGLSQGGIVPSYALVVREYMPAKEAGARVGFVLMATILGMALGGWLSGVTYDLSGSYTLAFVNGIIWNSANIAIITWLISRSRTNLSVAKPAKPST